MVRVLFVVFFSRTRPVIKILFLVCFVCFFLFPLSELLSETTHFFFVLFHRSLLFPSKTAGSPIVFYFVGVCVVVLGVVAD